MRVAVELRDFAIVLPARLKPGPTTFVIHNLGHYPHDLVTLFGPVHFASAIVAPGATATLRATLRPGAYVVACLLLNGGHLARGMIRVFAIGSRQPGSSRWQYP